MSANLALSRGARAELDNISIYYRALSPNAAENVLRDIEDVFRTLEIFPNVGMPSPHGELRRFVSARYRFKVVCTIEGGAVLVTAIYRHQNREF